MKKLPAGWAWTFPDPRGGRSAVYYELRLKYNKLFFKHYFSLLEGQSEDLKNPAPRRV
jgi:hypothetical protein